MQTTWRSAGIHGASARCPAQRVMGDQAAHAVADERKFSHTRRVGMHQA
ncbi:MAG: hypothetical protein R2854_23855 [Caldilineaceae bacterium]